MNRLPLLAAIAVLAAPAAWSQNGDPRVAPETAELYLDLELPGGGTERKRLQTTICPKAHIPVPMGGNQMLCQKQKIEPSERVKKMRAEAEKAGPGPAAQMHMMIEGKGGLYMYSKDANSPFVATLTCPAGTTPQVTDWPNSGDRLCIGENQKPKFGASKTGGRLYEWTGDKYKPLRIAKRCKDGAAPVPMDWPYAGDMACPNSHLPKMGVMNKPFIMEAKTASAAGGGGGGPIATSQPVTIPKAEEKPLPRKEEEKPLPQKEEEVGWWEGGARLFAKDPWKWAACTFNPFSWGSDDCKAPAEEPVIAKRDESPAPIQASMGPAPKTGVQAAHAHRTTHSPRTPAPKNSAPKGLSAARDRQGGTQTVQVDGVGAVRAKVEPARCKPGYLALRTGTCIKRASQYVLKAHPRVPIVGSMTHCSKWDMSDSYSWEKIKLCKDK